jgi:hypothetical protein
MRLRFLACCLLAALGAAPSCAADCPPGDAVALFVSPREPAADMPLRLIAVADDAPPDDIVVHAPDGRQLSPDAVAHGGPPWSLVATVDDPQPGAYRVEVVRGGTVAACRRLELPAKPSRGGAAETRRDWGRATEALYAAWIEHLFAGGEPKSDTMRGIGDVLHDSTHNFLFGHLRLGEDDGPRALNPTPDCADLPFFLRAYFAWKLGLPFAVRECGRGGGDTPPKCGPPSLSNVRAGGGDALGAFASFLRNVADVVQSGSGRTALGDDATDLYPVALTRASLRPGTVFADPYGHTLVLVRWEPPTDERAGMLIAVDAQPDTSVGYKRFWQGTFLFADEPGAGPGWKAFRPLVRTPTGLRPLANHEIDDGSGFPPWSDEQLRLDPDDFYARMSKLIDPDGLPLARAFETTLDALVEQLETRVGSVQNGEDWKRQHPGAVIPMPSGAAIFETTGPWEDFATPSRDMRLLIAMHVLETLPSRIVRYPELFVLQGQSPADAKTAMRELHERRVGERSVEYQRSDGSPWTLTVRDALARRAAFTMAYNPNDCVEVRWGAPEDGPERGPCRRHAPAEQRSRMGGYRRWFETMRRPSR